ncbi:MAG: hypothetical protein WAK03_01455 [Methylocystis sp.]
MSLEYFNRDNHINTGSTSARSITIDECRNLTGALRADLELIDYELRSVVSRMMSAYKSQHDSSLIFSEAASIVVLAIAASIKANSAAEANRPFNQEAFILDAKGAAQWAASRRLRHALGAEA